MAALTAEQILSAQDIEMEEVAVPEWGGTVFVKSLNGLERDEYEWAVGSFAKGKKNDPRQFRAPMLVRALVDENGKALFTLKQIEELSRKNGKVLDRCFEVAERLAGITSEDQEDLLKNSGAAQSGVSNSA